MLRKDRILEALRSMYAQRPAQSSALRRYAGFSAEDVADFTGVNRTNASRDLNLLAQEGKIERIPGRPVLFVVKIPSTQPLYANNGHGNWQTEHSPIEDVPLTSAQHLEVMREPGKPPAVARSAISEGHWGCVGHAEFVGSEQSHEGLAEQVRCPAA